MNILGGLSLDYNAVVTAINIRDDKILVEAIHSMLLAFENRLKQQSSEDQISIMTTNYAYSFNNRGGGRKYNGSRGHNYTSYTLNAIQKSHNVSYVANLAIQYTSTITNLIFPYQNSSNIGTNSLNMNIRNQNNIPAIVVSSNNLANDNWYLDSGASHHLIQNVENLTNSTPYTGTHKVTVGNGKHSSISNTGSQRLVSNSRSFQLKKVFHVPFISANLINVAKFCLYNNALIEFRSNSFLKKNLNTKKILARGRLENGLYKFQAMNKKKGICCH
ncbi:hypothetical protein POTOM_035288 [Populus tomentosa]|uniref:Retrovirus-related Pol polyprotein from transposon TNT 1-94-like beta-barrel domain-containing protein n=1 Tax=Populus tomentosa TaxID=118781 RepID=A0A8X8CM27_POPTO|nr:hypothetical protein POTOM_035288 [Populus tomentosa]